MEVLIVSQEDGTQQGSLDLEPYQRRKETDISCRKTSIHPVVGSPESLGLLVDLLNVPDSSDNLAYDASPQLVSACVHV